MADHPLAERLGWAHSHPYNMPTYSETDRKNQRFWSEPFHLGLLAYLDRDGSVRIVAFRGPDSEAIHPVYTASGRIPSRRERTSRPMRPRERRNSTPEAVLPLRPTTRRRHRLALLMLVVDFACSTAFLIAAWMIVQAIQELRDRSAQTVNVVKDGEATAGRSEHRAPDTVASPQTSKVPTPAKSVEQPTQKRHEPDTDDW